MKRIFKEFDGVREIVYISDLENQELLFMNKAGLEAFGYENMEQVVGRKCYEVLHGTGGPCAFCTNNQLSKDTYLEWIHVNPVTGRKYYLKDKLVEWEDRTARIEIAADMTENNVENMELGIKKRLESEKIVMDCIKMMYSSVETDVAINNTLEMLGKYLKGERTYVFHVYGKTMNNTYEWCAEGVIQEIDSLQDVPISTIDRWLPFFNNNECVIIEDLEQIRETAPEEYAVLKPQNITSLITVPMIEKGKLVGYFGVDNPHPNYLYEISNILKMLAYFFQSLLERKRREDYLKKIGFTDAMTGALNRNAFIRDTMPDDNRELLSAGCFFIDINGLKRTNDTYGHEAGDELICNIYRIVCSVAGIYSVYRLGGDEFVVLCQNISKQKLDTMETQMREELGGKHGCSAAVGVSFLENPKDLGIMLEEADKMMYEDKKRYYREHKE